MKLYRIIYDAAYICLKELKNVLKDQGVLMFLVIVPLAYPLLYSWIYCTSSPTVVLIFCFFGVFLLSSVSVVSMTGTASANNASSPRPRPLFFAAAMLFFLAFQV